MANIGFTVYVTEEVHQILQNNGQKLLYTADTDTLNEVLRNNGFNPEVVKLGYTNVNFVRLGNPSTSGAHAGRYKYEFMSTLDSSRPTTFYLIVPIFDGTISLDTWSWLSMNGDNATILRNYKNFNDLYDIVDTDGNKYQLWKVSDVTYAYNMNNIYMYFHYNWEGVVEPVASEVTFDLTHCTHNIGDNSYNVGDTADIVLTAEDGYEFTNGATVTIDGTSSTIEPSEDKKTISFPVTFGSTVTISASATEIPVLYPATYTCYGCTINLTAPLKYEYNTPINLVVTANDGKEMKNGTVKITTNIDTGATTTVDLVVSEDKKTATATFDSGYGFEVLATAVVEQCTINFSQLSHCHVVGNESNETITVNKHSSITITLALDEGYVWDYYTDYFLAYYIMDVKHNIEPLPRDYTTANFSFTIPDVTENVTVVYGATTQYTLPNTRHITLNLMHCSHNLTSTNIPTESEVNLVLTAEDGYKFVTNGSVVENPNIDGKNGMSYSIDNISSDGKTATVTFPMIWDVTVTMEAVLDPDSPPPEKPTYSITVVGDNNGTASALSSTAKEGDTVTLTVLPNEGYEFNSWVTSDVTISNNQFTMPNRNVSITATFKKIGETPTPTYYSITVTNDGHGTASSSVSTAQAGTTVTLVSSANEGYEFDKWVTSDVIVSNNQFVMPSKNVSINSTFKQTGTVEPPIEDGIKITFNLKNCSHNLPSIYVEYESSIDLVLTSDEGCEFDTYGTVVEDPENELYEGNKWNITDISEDKKTASISLLVFHPLTVTMVASKPIPEQLGGLTNIYKITTKQLKEITSKIYPRTSDGTIPNLSALETTGKFFINLIEFPFDIDRIVEEKVVELGYISTGVVVEGIPEYLYEVDLGSIQIDTKYKNYYDTIGSVRLFLPYTGEVSLPIEQVVGQTISIKYIVNMFTGQTTVNIYSTLNNILIASVFFVFGTELPFYEYRDRVFTSDLNIMGVYNQISKPFIEITRNKPYNVENQFGKPTVDYGKLSAYSGYIECGNVDVITKATVDEKLLIQQILKSGVIIK